MSTSEVPASAGSWTSEPSRRRAFATPRRACSSVISGILWLETPRLGAHELDEERIAARAFRHHVERCSLDVPTACDDRLPQCPLHLGELHGAEMVTLRAAQEREHVVVDDVADRDAETGADERELALFTEGVLDRRRELAELGDLVLVDLVQGDQEPGLVLGEKVGQQLDLVAQPGLDDVGLDGLPVETTACSGTLKPVSRRRTASGSKARSSPGDGAA